MKMTTVVTKVNIANGGNNSKKILRFPNKGFFQFPFTSCIPVEEICDLNKKLLMSASGCLETFTNLKIGIYK